MVCKYKMAIQNINGTKGLVGAGQQCVSEEANVGEGQGGGVKPIKTGVESRNSGADKRFKEISLCDPVSPGPKEGRWVARA